MIELVDKRSADMLAWLASRENRDTDLRQQAKDVLDKLYYIQFNCAIAPHGRKPKAQRIECPTDLQAARTDADIGGNTPTGPSDGLANNLLKPWTGCASPADR